MGVYGNGTTTANSQNVNFAYDLALAAARDLYQLSLKVASAQTSRASAAASARPDWKGGKRTTFDEKIAIEARDSSIVSDALVALANRFAQSWAQARGEQDRINTARWVQHEEDNENWAEKGYHGIVGQSDHGAPPGDPPTPTAPGYEPTRSPMHADFEHA